jgi:MFS family permease
MASRSILYLISWLSTVSAGLAGALFSTYLPDIVADIVGSTDRADIARVGSWAGGAFLLGWAIGAVGMGALADRIGRKRTLFLGTLTCALGVLGTAFVQSLPMLVLLRIATGVGAGTTVLLTAVMVSEAWATGDRAKMIGLLINAFPGGLIVAGTIAGAQPDFRMAYMMSSVMLLLPVAVWFFVPESAWWQRSGDMHAERHIARERLFSADHRKDLLVGLTLYGSMLVGLWAVFVWGPTWVGTLGDIKDAQGHRALTNVMLGLGSMLGGIISGPLNNAVGRRKAAMLGYVGCIVLSLATFVPTHQPGAVLFGLILVLSICIGINQGVLSTYIPELFPTLIRAAAAGLCFNVGRIITTVTVFFVGLLIPLLGGYNNAILTFALAYVVGLLTLHAARETRGIMLPE